MGDARAIGTDERLDDVSRRVEAGIDRVDEDLRSRRAELSGRIDGGIIAALLVATASLAVDLA